MMEMTALGLEKEILELEARVAEQTARKKKLAGIRDQAWETYRTLAKKVDELRVAKQVKGTEVRVASEAVVPDSPVSPRPTRTAGMAAVVGFMSSCLLAFFLEFMASVRKEER